MELTSILILVVILTVAIFFGGLSLGWRVGRNLGERRFKKQDGIIKHQADTIESQRKTIASMKSRLQKINNTYGSVRPTPRKEIR